MVYDMANKYYSLSRILEVNADYNIIFGERSNGKTYASLEYGLRRYLKYGEQMAYVRRWKEDLRGKRASSLFSGHISSGLLKKLTKQYNEIFYWSGKWYLSNYNAETKKRVLSDTPFCHGFCLSEVEHDKSTSYPDITTIVFDEFLTRKYYLVDEFVVFMNVLSTIIRDRGNVKIFMLGNTVNKFCPYFTEMGLKHVDKQIQGSIDVYRFGHNGCTVAVEYAASTQSNKSSNKYFAFDNEQLEMITGGKWELSVYPHLPIKYTPKDRVHNFYILFHENCVHGEVISLDSGMFIYMHRKTTPIQDKNAHLYKLNVDNNYMHFVKLFDTTTQITATIARLFACGRVFYQDNEIGDIVHNYIQESQRKFLYTK